MWWPDFCLFSPPVSLVPGWDSASITSVTLRTAAWPTSPGWESYTWTTTASIGFPSASQTWNTFRWVPHAAQCERFSCCCTLTLYVGSVGGIPPFQLHWPGGCEWLLPPRVWDEAGVLQRHQSVRQPHQLLGGAARHVPLRQRQARHSIWKLQEVKTRFKKQVDKGWRMPEEEKII